MHMSSSQRHARRQGASPKGTLTEQHRASLLVQLRRSAELRQLPAARPRLVLRGRTGEPGHGRPRGPDALNELHCPLFVGIGEHHAPARIRRE